MRSPAARIHPHSTPNRRAWQARLLVPLCLLVLTVIYFWPQLIQGRVLYWGDMGLYFTPMQAFLRDNLRQGRLPLWNPLIFCGTPYAGNPQTWPLYPITALLPWMSAPQFLNWTVALHVWLAGTGTYLFARRALGLRRGAALLAAVTFMFGGQLASKEQFPNMVQASAWLPWVLWRLDCLLRLRRVQDALALGLVLGLQLLAAHVQMTVLTLYLAAAYAVFEIGRRNLPRRTSSPPLPKREGKELGTHGPNSSPSRFGRVAALGGGVGSFGLLLLAGTVAACLAMGQILPTLALFRDAARQRLSFAIVDRFFLPANEISNFVLPRLHGQPFYGDWTARGNFWETCCYVGWLPFVLAVWGAVAAWRRRGAASARFWSVVLVFGVWMALGGRGEMYHLAYFALPGFRSFHDPARCLLWACFALSLLAGLGWERAARMLRTHPARLGSPPLPKREGQEVRTEGAIKTEGAINRAPTPLHPSASGGSPPLAAGWVLSGCVLLLSFADLAHFGRTLYPLADSSALLPTAPIIGAVQADPDIQAHQARIMAPSAGVWLRFTSPRDFRQNTPNYQSLWADTLTPNLTMPYGLEDAYGYEPVALKNAERVAGRADRAFEPKAPADQNRQAAAWAGSLGVKYVAVCRVTAPETTTPGLVPVRADPTLTPAGKKREQPARVYLSQNARWQPRARLEGSIAPVTLREDGPDQTTLAFTTEGPARLILADTQAAGWQATLDGNKVPIGSPDGFLRSIVVPNAGAHTVIFSYRPTPFRLGLYLSLLTVAGLVGYMTWAMSRKIFAGEGFAPRGVE